MVAKVELFAALTLALVGALLSGCARQSSRGQPLVVWLARDAPIQRRVEAVSELIPVGTRMEEALKLIGEPTSRKLLSGPIMTALEVSQGRSVDSGVNGKGLPPVHYRSIYRLVYGFSGGNTVCLDFDVSKTRGRWEDWPFIRVFSENTNNYIYIPPVTNVGLPRKNGHRSFVIH